MHLPRQARPAKAENVPNDGAVTAETGRLPKTNDAIVSKRKGRELVPESRGNRQL